MHMLALSHFLFAILLPLCSATSLTDEDIAKILDDTSRGEPLANLGEYENNLQLGDLRDKLRTLDLGLNADNADLFPNDDPDVLGGAVNINDLPLVHGYPSAVTSRGTGSRGTGSRGTGRLSELLSRLTEPTFESPQQTRRGDSADGRLYIVPRNTVSSLLSKDLGIASMVNAKFGNDAFNDIDLEPNDIEFLTDDDLDDFAGKTLTKRNLFCNRRTGCGKRGKRDRHKSEKRKEICSRFKCDAKRVLCNRQGCRSKRVDSLISKIYCGAIMCSSQKHGPESSSNFETRTTLRTWQDSTDTIKDQFDNINDTFMPDSSAEDVDESLETSFYSKRALLGLVRKSLSRQKRIDAIRKLRSVICNRYNVCAQESTPITNI